MAVVNKLSVENVLNKLRSNHASNSSRIEQLDEKLKTTDEEIQRLRAARARLKRGQPAKRN